MSQAQAPFSLSDFTDAIDLTYLRKIGKNDNRFVIQMLYSFAGTAQLIREQIGHHIQEKNQQGVGEELHKLVFALGVVGANQTQEQVRALEGKVKRSEVDPAGLQVACNLLDSVLAQLIQEAHSYINELAETS